MIVEGVGSDVMLEDGEARGRLPNPSRHACPTCRLVACQETRLSQRVHLYLGRSTSADGTGMLLVTTRRVVWVPEAQARGVSGFSLFYPAILVHAVSHDTSDFSHPCIYMQLDPEQNLGELASAIESAEQADPRASKRARSTEEEQQVTGEGEGEEDDDEDDEDEDETWQEVRLVPAMEADGDGAATDATLDAIYKALCDGAALNPDPDEEGEEEEEEGGVYFNSEESLAAATSAQLSMLERYEGMLDMSAVSADGRFDDAEEEQEEEEEEQEQGQGPAKPVD